jgi:hypothetical protein
MGQKQVFTCDCCGKIKEADELTHEITITKKGGPSQTKSDVCADCAKATYDFMEKRGQKKERIAKPKGAGKRGKRKGGEASTETQ